MFLLDTSVLTRLGAPSVVRRIEELDGDGLARTTLADLEIGFSARDADEWDRLVVALGAFRRIEVEAHHFARASQVQRKLAADGLEGRKVPDLLIAAVAEAASLTGPALRRRLRPHHIRDRAADPMDRRERIDRLTDLCWTCVSET